MGRCKKILAIILTLALTISGIQFATSTTVLADSVVANEWKNSAIVSPRAGELVGAGYIDIEWNNNLSNVRSYTVYLDGAEKQTVQPSSSKMSYEFYSTSITSHTTYIVATMNDNSTVQSNTTTFYVTKKGICVDTNMGQKVDAKSLNIGWYYNWGYEEFADNKNFSNRTFDNLEYVPMIWGQSAIKEVAFEKAKTKGYKYMLGYNEPDLRQQSNMSVSTVINRWYDFCNSGLRLGSPATATVPAWSDTWFKPFMQQINANSSLKVDFIAVHCYWETDIGAKRAALQFLEAMDETYAKYRKPIWITEFAVAGKKHFSTTDTKACNGVYDFMKVVLEGLNARSYVERYSWFTFDTVGQVGKEAGASGLWNYATGDLTRLGKLYADIGNPAGYNGANYNSYTASGVNSSIAACVQSVKTPLSLVKSTSKRTMKVVLQKVSNANGVQIKYSRYKSMKKSKTKTFKKALNKPRTFKISKLKRKKRYYVRARAYKVMNGKKYYCSWSVRKSVKVK